MSTNGVHAAEDAEMTDCDGEKVVTMMDVLQEQQEFEDDANAVLGASDDKECTYSKGYIKRQALYACLTCCSDAKTDPDKRAGVCLACSLNCHENHELIELYTKRNFRCDCGNPKFNSHPCQFTPDKSDLNTENVYNQNFIGLYCVCHRPYPDPESPTEDEMIQCIVCEDWLHASHLEAVVPSVDQYAEMICKACMDKNDFLHDYTEIAVNCPENENVDVTNTTVDESLISNGVLEGKTNGDVTMDESKEDGENITTTKEVENENEAKESITENVEEPISNEESKEENDTDVPIEKEVTNKPSQEHVDNKETDVKEPVTESLNDKPPQPCTEDEPPKVAEPESNDAETDAIFKSIDEITEPENVKEKEEATEVSEVPSGEKPTSKIESSESTNETATENKDDKPDETTTTEDSSENKSSGDVSQENEKITDNEVNPELRLEESKDSEEKPEVDTSDTNMDISSQNVEEDKQEAEKTIADGESTDEISKAEVSAESAVSGSGESTDEISKAEVSEQSSEIKDTEERTEQPSETEPTEENASKTDVEMEDKSENIENGTTHNSEEISAAGNENKRKLSTEDTQEDISAKKAKIDDGDSCARPKGVKKTCRGAVFWPANFRQKLCTCNECITMYKDLSVLFLTDLEDTVTAYEALGKEKINGAATTQYEKGLEALSSLDRIQQINALTEYNKMRDKLLDFLKSFKDRREIVKEEDIKAFFAGMKPKREPDGVYFCR